MIVVYINKNLCINLRFHLVILGVIKKSSATSLYNRFVIQCIYNLFFARIISYYYYRQLFVNFRLWKPKSVQMLLKPLVAHKQYFCVSVLQSAVTCLIWPPEQQNIIFGLADGKVNLHTCNSMCM